MSAALQPHRASIRTCAFCPKMCRFACPVDRAEGKETLSPWGKMTALNRVIEGHAPLDGEVRSIVDGCTGCKACTTACVHRQELPPVFEAARAAATRAGHTVQALEDRAEAVRAHGNPVGPSLSTTLREMVPPDRFTRRGADVLLALGCTTLKREPGTVGTILGVLDRSGVRYAVAGPEAVCSGEPLAAWGYPELFLVVARKNHKRFDGFSTVVADCPGAASAVSQRYRRAGLRVPPRVLHLTSFLAALLAEGKLTDRRRDAPEAASVVYHDACHLGRWLGEYDAPRQLLGEVLGGPPGELFSCRESGLCSGGGGGYPLTHPGGAASVARQTLTEIPEEHGMTLVTACPTARKMFRRARPDLCIADPVELL